MEVNNTWKLESQLGSGGFGIVQLWKNTCNNEQIAIKISKTGDTRVNTKQNNRWKEEIRIMNQLQHPNIVSTKPLPDEIKNMNPWLPMLCMEYCRRGDLRRVLNDIENCCGLAEPAAIQVMKDISGAVEYLHYCGLTHRDLKPENVVLQQTNDKIVYKLIDLGYAKALGHDSEYASIVGTLNYVAPELLWTEKYTRTVDYWSLGILFYEIITGYRPFLPGESNPILWRTYIQGKSYKDICAYYVDSNIVFGQDIQDPNQIAPCVRDALVEWFRIVLQWDSKKRGKIRQENGTEEIIVFKMLKQILFKKVIEVFCVSEYKIYCYQVDDTTSLAILQSQIQRDTRIPTSSQELINLDGDIVNDDTILQRTNSRMTLFNKEGTTQLKDLPMSNLPTLVARILETPKAEMTHYELKRCYSAAMFFVKKEFDLFSYYIVALSMQIDQVNTKFDRLLSKKDEMILGIDSLKNEFHKMSQIPQCDMRNGCDEWQRQLQTLTEKQEFLSETVNDLKVRCNKFLRMRDTLTMFGDVDWMTEYYEFLDKVQDTLGSCRIRPVHTKHQPIHMAKLIGKFLKFRQIQMNNEKLVKIESQIRVVTTVQATAELLNLENFVDSAIALIAIQRKKIRNLLDKWQNGQRATSFMANVASMDIEMNTNDAHPFVSTTHSTDEIASVSSDSVIYDNLVIRYMMFDVMSDTYEKFLQIMNLEP